MNPIHFSSGPETFATSSAPFLVVLGVVGTLVNIAVVITALVIGWHAKRALERAAAALERIANEPPSSSPQ